MSEERKFTYSALEMIEVLKHYEEEIARRPAMTKELEKLAYTLKASRVLLDIHYDLGTQLLKEKTGEECSSRPCVTIPVEL